MIDLLHPSFDQAPATPGFDVAENYRKIEIYNFE